MDMKRQSLEAIVSHEYMASEEDRKVLVSGRQSGKTMAHAVAREAMELQAHDVGNVRYARMVVDSRGKTVIAPTADQEAFERSKAIALHNAQIDAAKHWKKAQKIAKAFKVE